MKSNILRSKKISRSNFSSEFEQFQVDNDIEVHSVLNDGDNFIVLYSDKEDTPENSNPMKLKSS